MFKKLEERWNAHTPKFLHNRTKENLIFQLILTVLLIGGMELWDKYQENKRQRELENTSQ